MAKKEEYTSSMVRAVKVLDDDLKKKAKKMNLDDDDLVLVKIGQYHSEPDYDLVKIDGSIIEFYRKNGIVIKK